MFENDHSAARGKMAVRQLIVFKHDSELGNAPSHKLFDLVHAEHNEDVIRRVRTRTTPSRLTKPTCRPA